MKVLNLSGQRWLGTSDGTVLALHVLLIKTQFRRLALFI